MGIADVYNMIITKNFVCIIRNSSCWGAFSARRLL